MWTMNTIEWIDIELTSFCNISCKGCFRVISKQSDKILNKTYIDMDTIKKRFQKEMFPNIQIINFCGSVDEPTTHPQFFDIVEHFASWNVHINVATNGSLKTPQWWQKLAKILPPGHRVTWGIDGSDETSEIYREGSNFKKVQENFRAFIAAGGQAVWQFIEFEHNMHQTEIAKQMATDEGFKKFITINSHRKDTNGIKHKKIEPVQQSTEISCKYGNQKRIFVNHMGNVIPCCHLNSKMMEYSVTNEVKDKFEQILVNNDYKNDINLDNVSIEQAINGNIWSNIIDSWKKDAIPRCESVCKQKIRDSFVHEEIN
jgi:MoaA/NifB/PqqE/SkfB family radical SAM enzyme